MTPRILKKHPAHFNLGEIRVFDDGARYRVIAKDNDLMRVRLTQIEHSDTYLKYMEFIQQLPHTDRTQSILKLLSTVLVEVQKDHATHGRNWMYKDTDTLWMDYASCMLNTQEIDYSDLEQEQL